jgi:hypothetical protein
LEHEPVEANTIGLVGLKWLRCVNLVPTLWDIAVAKALQRDIAIRLNRPDDPEIAKGFAFNDLLNDFFHHEDREPDRIAVT